MKSFKKQVRLYAGRAGVESSPGCYGLPTYCGWQQVAGTIDVPALSPGRMEVTPTVAPHFNPKAVYMFGIDPASPSTNLRFTIGAITVGGRTQLATYETRPDGLGGELLSDTFNRSDQPLIVEGWAFFSTPGLGSPLVIDLFNLNAIPIRIFVAFWGNAIDEEFMQSLGRT